MSASEPLPESPSPTSLQRWRAFVWRMLKRTLQVMFALFLIYWLIVLIGLAPVNNDFQPAQEDGVTIYVASDAVHSDFILPVANDVIDWREVFPPECFPVDTRGATHVAIGWGDRGFYLETPTWAELKASTAAKALFLPSGCCAHVVMTLEPEPGPNVRSVTVSREQYQKLVQFILDSFPRDAEGSVQQIPDAGYFETDAFFQAHGNYHALNTCNSWVGRGMRTSGLRCPILTPMPKSIWLYLPDSAENPKP